MSKTVAFSFLVAFILGFLLFFGVLGTPRFEEADFFRILVLQSVDGRELLNPIKYVIRVAVASGISPSAIVLLLLLPLSGAMIAAGRHVVGIRGFGIFLPAALSVVFLAIGPVLGIGLFVVIIAISIANRLVLKSTKVRLQYLPRAALLLLFVTLAVLGFIFVSSVFKLGGMADISVFPILFLVLLSEDFTRVQVGKSVRTAIVLTTETIFLALVSYFMLTLKAIQVFAITNPEILLTLVAAFDIVLGRYTGLRVLEFWRFRKLIRS